MLQPQISDDPRPTRRQPRSNPSAIKGLNGAHLKTWEIKNAPRRI
jgi:hypothetical protein